MNDINERHRDRMARKKAIIDAKIAAADKNIGVLIVNTGNGKGKSSSGFGMAMRAMGHGMKVGVVQFIKGAMSTGEEQFLRRFPEECSFHAMGEGYTWEKPRTASATSPRRGKPGSRRAHSCATRPTAWWCWMN
jgi:cob(I)alamin adenosyltransferase